MRRLKKPSAPIALVVLALVVLATVVFVATRGPGKVTVTARFASTVGLYKGSEVRLMGVPIGEVTAVEPEGESVRVEMAYDASYRLPADARAVIISPSVVADRFVQLTPTYDGSGPTLEDRATIPVERTGVPVELDRIYEASHDLMTALGPRGANREGALSRNIKVGADNLKGQGAALRAMLHEFSGAMDTLGGSSDDFFKTVGNLQTFTTMLANNDREVRRFNRQMATISSFLAGEGDDLEAMFESLAGALGTVEGFVRRNRGALAADVHGLSRVTGILVKQRAALVELTELAPLGLNNVNRTWDPVAQAVRTRNNSSETFRDLGVALCDALKRGGVPDPQVACTALKALLAGTTK